MKRILIASFAVLLLQTFSNFSRALASPRLVVIDSHENHPHQKKIRVLFEKELKKDLVFLDLYNAQGELIEDLALKSLSEAAGKGDVVHLSWNLPYDKNFDKIILLLNKISKDKILVAAAGAPVDPGQLTSELKNTVMGKVGEAFLIGELNSKGHLALNAYFGEPMFTALVPPSGYQGSSFSSVSFTVALVKAIKKDPKKDWKSYLRVKRTQSNEKYPNLKALGL